MVQGAELRSPRLHPALFCARMQLLARGTGVGGTCTFCSVAQHQRRSHAREGLATKFCSVALRRGSTSPSYSIRAPPALCAVSSACDNWFWVLKRSQVMPGTNSDAPFAKWMAKVRFTTLDPFKFISIHICCCRSKTPKRPPHTRLSLSKWPDIRSKFPMTLGAP